MKPTIELFETEMECMCMESPTLGLKEGEANPNLPNYIKGNIPTDAEDVLGLDEVLKLW